MSAQRLESLKIKAKLLQKAKAKSGSPIQLKEAFLIIAKAAGYSSWQDLKEVVDANGRFLPVGHSAYWKNWHASYDEALAQLEELNRSKQEHFLIPNEKEFFICDSHFIEFLGIAIDDFDLIQVGVNWVEPKDKASFAKLTQKIKLKVS